MQVQCYSITIYSQHMILCNIYFAGTVDANHLPPGHHSGMPGVTIPDRYDENSDDHHDDYHDDYHDECDYHNDHNMYNCFEDDNHLCVEPFQRQPPRSRSSLC